MKHLPFKKVFGLKYFEVSFLTLWSWYEPSAHAAARERLVNQCYRNKRLVQLVTAWPTSPLFNSAGIRFIISTRTPELKHAHRSVRRLPAAVNPVQTQRQKKKQKMTKRDRKRWIRKGDINVFLLFLSKTAGKILAAVSEDFYKETTQCYYLKLNTSLWIILLSSFTLMSLHICLILPDCYHC